MSVSSPRPDRGSRIGEPEKPSAGAVERSGTPYVRVRREFDVPVYPNCTMDMPQHNLVVVTDLTTERVVKILEPGTWFEAVAFGSDGYPTHAYDAALLARELQLTGDVADARRI